MRIRRITARMIMAWLLMVLISACQTSEGEQNSEPKDDFPVFHFETTEYDFGEITEGEVVTHDFVFTNIGGKDLLISKVRASCGCTAPDWTKEPVEPGESGVITVKFDSKNRPGVNRKTVRVKANTREEEIILSFRAEVIPKDE